MIATRMYNNNSSNIDNSGKKESLDLPASMKEARRLVSGVAPTTTTTTASKSFTNLLTLKNNGSSSSSHLSITHQSNSKQPLHHHPTGITTPTRATTKSKVFLARNESIMKSMSDDELLTAPTTTTTATTMPLSPPPSTSSSSFGRDTLGRGSVGRIVRLSPPNSASLTFAPNSYTATATTTAHLQSRVGGSSVSLLRSHASAPSLALQRRRIISSGNLSNGSARSSGAASAGSAPNANNTNNAQTLRGNAVIKIAQRSNGSAVKSVIAQLQQTCQAAASAAALKNTMAAAAPANPIGQLQALATPAAVTAPHQQMALISQWASVDSYYKTVITKYHGMEAIVATMKYFPHDADIQVYGCTALGHLPNKALIHSLGGVTSIVQALQEHSSHFEVQSHAWEALKKQGALLRQESAETCVQLQGLVEKAQKLYLTKAGKEGSTFVGRFLQTYHAHSSQKPAASSTKSKPRPLRSPQA